MGSPRKYLEIGSRYGRWTVVKLQPLIEYHPTEYTCECDCGFIQVIAANTLKRKASTQCGKCANSRWRKICFNCKGDINDKESTR